MEVPESMVVLPWADPVIDPIGHDPRSRYVELFWLGILGPTATLLLRRLADGLESYPDGYELDVPDLARGLGIKLQGQRRAAFVNAMERTVLFGMAQHHTHGLLVRRRMPPLSHRQVMQLPPRLRDAHDEWAVPTALAAPEHVRWRAEALAGAMLATGDEPELVERQLALVGVSPAVAVEAMRTAMEGGYAPTAASTPEPA
jgi:hypothetical protein